MGLGDTVVGWISDDRKSSSLNGFLSKFNSSQGKYVDKIDTLNTFDVTFDFLPTIPSGEKGGGILGGLMTVADNLTGGLAGQVVDAFSDQKSFNDLKDENKDTGKTIVDYILKGNLIDYTSDKGTQLTLTYYAQQMTLPNIIMRDESSVETMFGDFPVNGKMVKPSTNTFQMDVINTKSPILERVFYPWMREVTLPYWSYPTQPYTTANVTVDFKKHANVKYIFLGCRPNNITSIQPTNELNGSLTRQVSFIFDWMFIQSDDKVKDDLKNSLYAAGTSLLNGAGGMLGL